MPAGSVLVVDDDDEVRAMAVAVMASLGLLVYEAADGPTALAVLDEQPEIAVLFSDVRMPGMSGVELAREAVRRRPGLRVVLTSGYLGGADVQGLPLLRKPYRLHDLQETLCVALLD